MGRKLALTNGNRIDPMELVFAARGHDWDHFFNYVDKLEMQSRTETLFLKGPGLHHVLLERSKWKVELAEHLAGLQCADIVASAFYQAVNSVSPSHDVEPAKALSKIVASQNGRAHNAGVTLFPLANQADVPAHDRAIFEHYGYEF